MCAQDGKEDPLSTNAGRASDTFLEGSDMIEHATTSGEHETGICNVNNGTDECRTIYAEHATAEIDTKTYPTTEAKTGALHTQQKKKTQFMK